MKEKAKTEEDKENAPATLETPETMASSGPSGAPPVEGAHSAGVAGAPATEAAPRPPAHFTKQAVLNAKRWEAHRDILKVLLADTRHYTERDIENAINGFSAHSVRKLHRHTRTQKGRR